MPSLSSAKRSYAAVVAGVKAEPTDWPLSQNTRKPNDVTQVAADPGPAAPTTGPTPKPRVKSAIRVETPSAAPSTLDAENTSGTQGVTVGRRALDKSSGNKPKQPALSQSNAYRSKKVAGPLLSPIQSIRSALETAASNPADSDGASSNVAVRGSSPASPGDSGPDSGAILDPEDGGYRGRVTNTLIANPADTSIIKTRSARAAEAQKTPSLPPPSSSRRLSGLSGGETSLTPPPSTQPRPIGLVRPSAKGRSKRPSNRGKGGVGRAAARKSAIVQSDRVSGEETQVERVLGKRLRTQRPKSPVTVLVPSSDGEDSDNPFLDNPASSGIEDYAQESDVEANSSDAGSLKDFIVDDTAMSDDGATADGLMSDVDEHGEGVPPSRSPGGDLGMDIDEAQETPRLVKPSSRAQSRQSNDRNAYHTTSQSTHGVTIPTPLAPHQGQKGVGSVDRVDEEPTRSDPSSFITPQRPRSFAAAIASAPKKQAKTTATPSRHSAPLLEDLFHFRVATEPDACEVTSEALQDPLLKEFYAHCPNLRAGCFQSWSEASGPGMIFFSRWAEICPDLDFDTCISIIQLVQSGKYINPSRLSPTKACIQLIPGARPKYHLCTSDRQMAVCLSPVMSVDSHVVTPPDRGLRQKWLSAIFHSQEWERFVSFMCMVFGHDTLQAQLAKDAIQFTTRADFGSRGGAVMPSRKATMFSNIRSPSIVSKLGGVRGKTADSMTLDFDTPIPVYDCRKVALDFSQGVGDLESYPKWTREIPYGSFVVVAYTVAVFRASSTNLWTISLNLQWAMMLGVDPEQEHDEE